MQESDIEIGLDPDLAAHLASIQRPTNTRTSFESNNSPTIMSLENSDDSDPDDGPHASKFKKLSVRQVEQYLEKFYSEDDQCSNELDILTTYLKGQKNIYMKSREFTQMKLNMLMVPSLIGSAVITVFSPIIQGYSWSGAFISGLNACVTLIMSIIHYFKLESSTEMYFNLASQYDKLENSIEFASNKLGLIMAESEKADLVISKIIEIEKRVIEIKENTKVLIPYELKTVFPIICNMNIFSFMKRMKLHRKNLIMKLRDIKNEILYIQWKKVDDVPRMKHLFAAKDKLKHEIIQYKNAYGTIDELFIREIQFANGISLMRLLFIGYTALPNPPVLSDYLKDVGLAI